MDYRDLNGTVTGQTKAMSTPVTAALRSPRVLFFPSRAR